MFGVLPKQLELRRHGGREENGMGFEAGVPRNRAAWEQEARGRSAQGSQKLRDTDCGRAGDATCCMLLPDRGESPSGT